MQKSSYANIGDHARLELGFRIKSTQASYRELEKLLGAAQRVKWANSPAHKGGATYFAIPTQLDEDDRVWVPDGVIDAFTRYGGLLMVKLVTALPPAHYANLALYHRLWDFDRVDPQRENGEWVYSMPIHGLEAAGEGHKFFFVIRLDQAEDKEKVILTVDRVDVTRGKEHFTIGPTKQFGPFPPTHTKYIEGVAQAFEISRGEGKGTYKPLKDLPIGAAVRQYLDRLR